jgi:hypothetical protein
VPLQALQGGVLTAAMLEHLTSEQSEWLLAHLAATSPKAADPPGSSSADDGGPVVKQTTSDQHEALTDFLVGAQASGEQLSNQQYGCLAQHCKVRAARAAACGKKDRHMSWLLECTKRFLQHHHAIMTANVLVKPTTCAQMHMLQLYQADSGRIQPCTACSTDCRFGNAHAYT